MSIRRRDAWLLLAGCALTACGASPTQLSLSITASTQLNPDAVGGPSPLVLKFYELVSSDAFGTATFSTLFYAPNDALRSDLLNVFIVEVTPGSKTVVKRTLDPQAQCLGIVAGYRDMANAVWRSSKPLAVHASNPINLIAGRLALSYGAPAGLF